VIEPTVSVRVTGRNHGTVLVLLLDELDELELFDELEDEEEEEEELELKLALLDELDREEEDELDDDELELDTPPMIKARANAVFIPLSIMGCIVSILTSNRIYRQVAMSV
jgi:hypothetical protein